jgi:hypothetical protein
MKTIASILLACLATGAGVMTTPASAAKAYPANVYFHFTDGKGNDFRIPLAVPGLTECNQTKLAAMAKARAKNDPMFADWTYVRAECRAPRK